MTQGCMVIGQRRRNGGISWRSAGSRSWYTFNHLGVSRSCECPVPFIKCINSIRRQGEDSNVEGSFREKVKTYEYPQTPPPSHSSLLITSFPFFFLPVLRPWALIQLVSSNIVALGNPWCRLLSTLPLLSRTPASSGALKRWLLKLSSLMLGRRVMTCLLHELAPFPLPFLSRRRNILTCRLVSPLPQ